MQFTLDEIIKATKATIIKCNNKSARFAVSTDTRTITPDDIYLPLKGENFDGHDFVEDAINKGVKAYFTSKKRVKYDDAQIILYVKDTLIAYLLLAKYYRKKLNPVVIGITGSSGKTTTKEMVASVLEENFKVHKSPLNHNNEIGMCQTILSAPENTDILVLEMGMRGLNEIKILSNCSEPDIGVIVNIGSAHIGRLKTVENIAKAKCEIITGLHKEGILFACDSELVRNANRYLGETLYLSLNMSELKIIEKNIKRSKFLFKGYEYVINVSGDHNILDSLYAICVGLKFGMNPKMIAMGLSKYKPIEKRWEMLDAGGYKIINDSYNSNPESVKAALTTFLGLYEGNKVVVLGNMGELGLAGKDYHREVGEFINKYGDVTVITVGKLARYITDTCKYKTAAFDDNKSVAKYIVENIPEGTTILFKASRSMKFEEIISELEELKK